MPLNRELVYEYVGWVTVGAQAPLEKEETSIPPISGWKIRGTLKLQMIDNTTLAAGVSLFNFQNFDSHVMYDVLYMNFCLNFLYPLYAGHTIVI